MVIKLGRSRKDKIPPYIFSNSNERIFFDKENCFCNCISLRIIIPLPIQFNTLSFFSLNILNTPVESIDLFRPLIDSDRLIDVRGREAAIDVHCLRRFYLVYCNCRASNVSTSSRIMRVSLTIVVVFSQFP